MSTDANQNATADAFRDLMAGTVAGMNVKIVEYPLDTVKVRIQDANSKYNGVFDCFTRMWKEEGARAFLRGLSAPIVGSMLENASVFFTYGRLKQLIRETTGAGKHDDLLLWQYALCGAGAGVAASSVLTPFELVKCRMQVQDTLPLERRIYRNTLHCAVSIVKADGPVGLFRGVSPMLAREIPGNACWYTVYESSRHLLAQHHDCHKTELPLYKSAMAGGAAGFWYWTAFFPADVVKTRIQIDPRYAQHTLVQGLRDVYKEGGVRALYSGWALTAGRAVPSNAVLFASYEACYSAMEKHFF
eukprot:PhM_4_TR13883/c0_g1_i1/m.56449